MGGREGEREKSEGKQTAQFSSVVILLIRTLTTVNSVGHVKLELTLNFVFFRTLSAVQQLVASMLGWNSVELLPSLKERW